MENKLLVAIPCYNCSVQIERVIDEFDELLLGRVGEVVIIDNQSTDDTINSAVRAIIKKQGNKFKVFKNNANYGLGGSHKVAFDYAFKKKYDYVAILHGDNQAKTQELNFLMDNFEKNKHLDVVLGSRFMLKSRLQGYSIIRILGNVVLNFVFTVISGHKTKDLGSGLNIFKTKSLADKRYLNFNDDLTFNIDLLLDFYRKKTLILFCPITWSETDQVSNAKVVKVAIMALKILIFWRMHKLKRINRRDYASSVIFY